MTSRERLTNLLDGKPVDRLPWTTLVDDTTRSVMPDDIRQMPLLEFYRHIGCDFASFGNYGFPRQLQVQAPCRRIQPDAEEIVEKFPDGRVERRTKTPWGTLTAVSQGAHPLKYPVETIEELRILKRIWLSTRYEEVGPASEESFRRTEAAIGSQGLFSFTLEPSPMQTVLEFDMGLAAAYALLADHPEEFEELLAVMHSRRMQEYEICARRMPCRVIIPVENTSTTLISPRLYERLSLPHIRDLVDLMHRHGKLVVLHMCGLLRDLLPLIRQTGADGVNALTPPPIGNTTIEDALDALGENILIWGAMLDGAVFNNPNFDPRKLEAALERTYTPRVRQSRCLLWVAADGLPTPIDRFLAVRDWMERSL